MCVRVCLTGCNDPSQLVAKSDVYSSSMTTCAQDLVKLQASKLTTENNIHPAIINPIALINIDIPGNLNLGSASFADSIPKHHCIFRGRKWRTNSSCCRKENVQRGRVRAEQHHRHVKPKCGKRVLCLMLHLSITFLDQSQIPLSM